MACEMKPIPGPSLPHLDPPGLAALRKRNAHLLRVPVNGRDHPAYYLCYPGTGKPKEVRGFEEAGSHV
jgi:hypothetical protein